MMHTVRIGVVSALLAASGMFRVASAEEESPRKLPLVVGVARVRVEIARKHVVVIHDVNLARGDFRGEDIDAFASFGAPGAPKAIEARLLPVPRGSLEAPASERGVTLPWSYAPRRPSSAWPLLGRPTMAGVLLQLAGNALERALNPGGMATLRLRALHPLPAPDADGQQEVLVRLGDLAGTPLILGRVEVASAEPLVERIEAHLCRAGVLGERLSVRVVSPSSPVPVPVPVPVPGSSSSPAAPTTVTTVTTTTTTTATTTTTNRATNATAPVLATRTAGEDLCVRFGTRKTQKSGSATAAPES